MKGRSRTGGLTLIEMLVAIAMLGVLATSTVAFLTTLPKVNRQTSDDQGVTIAAKTYIEDAKASWSDATNFDNGTLPTVTDAKYQASGYTCTAATATVDTTTLPVPRLKRVTFTCTGTRSDVAGRVYSFVAQVGRP